MIRRYFWRQKRGNPLGNPLYRPNSKNFEPRVHRRAFIQRFIDLFLRKEKRFKNKLAKANLPPIPSYFS